jgi:threonyl-tRNA synthetase
VWSKAEQILIDAAKGWGVPYSIEEGEAAFYGPKIDVRVKDALGRDWQLTTIQLDFVQPENFDMTYVGEDGKRHRPAVLHIAIIGSTQRFMGVLIEHFGGLFPLWLAPVQAAVLPVAKANEGYGQQVLQKLREAGIRVEYTDATETLSWRIREGEKQHIPYLLVLGERETKEGKVAVRNVRTKAQITVPLTAFLREVLLEVRERRLTSSLSAPFRAGGSEERGGR